MDQEAPSRELLQRPTQRFDYVAPTVRQLPGPIAFVRRHLFNIFVFLVFSVPAAILVYQFFDLHAGDNAENMRTWLGHLKYLSIPVVSVIFTWWHVWLGIQMCWYPIEFVGIPPIFGWQGIVPRRANVMADRACDLMIGNLITVEEIIERVEPEDFFLKLGPVMGRLCAAVLARLALKHCPHVWELLPDNVKEELKQRVYEESQLMFRPVIADIKKNVNRIFNIKHMAVEALTSDKKLLVHMFQEIGRREFKFVLHVAAVMGCILGCTQMMLWKVCHEWWILPISGLCIGYFTNWLAISMIFRPVHPHIICGGYINVQGVFLKRQSQVATELSNMLCTQLIYARRMLEYVVRNEGFESVLEIYQKHMEEAIDQVVGRAKVVLPVFVGHTAIQGIKDEVIAATLEELPHHSKDIEEYMDRTFALDTILAPRLRGLPPEEFEGMLRPVFQEDEWMVLLLGGVLGVVVGSVQAMVLKN